MRDFKILVSELTSCYGGMEAVELQYCRELEKVGIHSDFIVRSSDISYLDKLPSSSRLFYIPEKMRDPLEYKRELRKLFARMIDYDVFWANHNQLTNIDFLKAAATSGIPIRILHSHSAGMDGSPLRRMVHALNRERAKKLSNRLVACSESAGNFMFDDSDFTVLPNLIDVTSVSFDMKKRQEVRMGLGFEDCFIYGAVGRIEVVKNHLFLLELFPKLLQRNPKARLVIVGDGSQINILKKAVESSGLNSYISFVGVQDDVQGYLSSFDCFCMPSLFEGLPISLLEAQFNGLPCVCSDNIDRASSISNAVHFTSLENEEGWIRQLSEVSRKDVVLQENSKRYDSRNAVEWFTEILDDGKLLNL